MASGYIGIRIKLSKRLNGKDFGNLKASQEVPEFDNLENISILGKYQDTS
jgi:hypothetical protein